MRYSLYPGCTLKQKAKDFEDSAIRAANSLGVELSEIDEWQCCGAVYPLAKDEFYPLLSPVRSLAAVKEENEKMVTLCAACHHVFKRANHAIKTDKYTREKLTSYLEVDYSGEVDVLHYFELLRDEIGFDKIAAKVKAPLKDRKLAAYYGCLLLRPQKEMQFDDPERPTIMEDFIRSVGAEVVDYPFKTECCGAYLAITEEKLATDTVGKILLSAYKNGAQGIVVSCPLCHYNLVRNQQVLKEEAGYPVELPVYYFTELLAEALGV